MHKLDVSKVPILLSPLLAAYLVLMLGASPFAYFDDAIYMGYAHEILLGNFHPNFGDQGVELLTVASMAVSYRLFGVSVGSAGLPTMVAYLVLVAIAFFTGKEIMGDWAGMLSAFFCMSTAFVVGFAGRALPDILAAVPISCALYLLIRERRLGYRRGYMLLSGFAAGLTMSFKFEGSLLILVFFLAALVVCHLDFRNRKLPTRSNFGKFRRYSPLFYVFIGIVMAVYLNFAYFFSYTGNPLYPIRVYSTYNVQNTPAFLQQLSLFNMMVNPFYLVGDRWGGNAGTFPMGFGISLAALGMLVSLIKKDRNLMILSLCFVLPLLYFFFGTLSLKTYKFIPISTRYFAIIILPTAALAGCATFYVYNALAKFYRPMGLIAVFMILLTYAVLNLPTYELLAHENSNIRSISQTYGSALGAVLNTSASGTVYVSSLDTGIEISFLDTIIKYNKNFRITPTALNCQASYSGNFLLVVTNGADTGAILNNTDEWLGDNCTAYLLKSYGAPMYGVGPFEISAYSLRPKNVAV